MMYLLDVNALVALGFLQHEFHDRVGGWVRGVAANREMQLATCSITELGFLRVLAQAPQYGVTLAHARNLLLRLKASSLVGFTFLEDANEISHLSGWVKTAKQITDGHLASSPEPMPLSSLLWTGKFPGHS